MYYPLEMKKKMKRRLFGRFVFPVTWQFQVWKPNKDWKGSGSIRYANSSSHRIHGSFKLPPGHGAMHTNRFLLSAPLFSCLPRNRKDSPLFDKSIRFYIVLVLILCQNGRPTISSDSCKHCSKIQSLGWLLFYIL